MRQPTEIAAEMENLPDDRDDEEAAHMTADRLLLELVEALAAFQPPAVADVAFRAVAAWRRGSQHWWWA